ncbi:response regulator [Thalassococcus sp. BH17M4-6]|uniref:response regulator n=1 Tax=Thalassococcus sp. BH17M4-6 TaxID=3413148 RepID=UPI003BE68C8B
MIVEDEALVLMDIVMTVEEAGFDIHSECTTLTEAFAALEKGVPDIALLDINIRHELIWPVARKLRTQGCKVVFTSADCAHKELRTEFQDCAFVEKPVSPHAIGDALHETVAAE